MRARYENDLVRGPGYGLLQVEDAGVESTDVRFSLIRSGDLKTLHPENWEDAECRLVPDGVAVRGSGMCLAVGPGVVRRLDELNTYRFVLFPPAGDSLKAPLELSGIIYPPEDGMNRVSPPQAGGAALLPPPAKPPALELRPEPKYRPAPQSLPPLAPARAGKPLPVWLIALLLLLTVAGAWFMLQDKPAGVSAAVSPAEQAGKESREEKPQSEPSEPESSGPEASESAPSGEAPEVKEPEPGASVQSPPGEQPAAGQVPAAPPAPLERVRQFLRGGGSAADGLALSRSLPRTPEGRDAAYLLLEAAAEQGQPEAMLEVAAFYDPLDVNAKGSILPDAEQAWEWYGKAEKAGQAGAAGRKQALRAWIEAEAGKGSAEARDILSRIK